MREITLNELDPALLPRDQTAEPAQPFRERLHAAAVRPRQAEIFLRSAPILTQHANGMRIIQINQPVVRMNRLQVSRQRGDLAGDRKDSIAQDQRALAGAQLTPQAPLQMLHLAVMEWGNRLVGRLGGIPGAKVG